MSTNKEHAKRRSAMKTPPVVSQQEWEAARQQLLVKEKALTRSRDALALILRLCRFVLQICIHRRLLHLGIAHVHQNRIGLHLRAGQHSNAQYRCLGLSGNLQNRFLRRHE